MTSPVQTQTSPDTLPDYLRDKFALMPGLALAGVVAWLGIMSADWLGEHLLGFERSPISGIMMAILIGLLIGNVVSLPTWTKAGIAFSLKFMLRAGIVLLGIRLSLGAVVQVGVIGLPVIIACVTGGLWLARWLGRRLGLSERLSVLVAVGTSICGATAIAATAPVLEAKEEELTYAIANITVFGVVAMFLYPFFAHALFADQPLQAGLFLGTSIHETAQVAGAGLIYHQMYDDETVLNVATISKLVRNVFMIAVIPLMAYAYQRQHKRTTGERPPLRSLFPTFILGFLLMAVLRTLGDATLLQTQTAFGFLSATDWQALTGLVNQMAEVLLAVAMAGIGLGTRLMQLRQLGIKPFYVGLGAALSVAVMSLVALMLLGSLGIF